MLFLRCRIRLEATEFTLGGKRCAYGVNFLRLEFTGLFFFSDFSFDNLVITSLGLVVVLL